MAEPAGRRGAPRTIILATDLGCHCDRAMDRAAALAAAWDARLVAVHVLPPEPPAAREQLPSWRRPADRRLAMAAQLRRDLGIQAPRLDVRIEEGEPAAGIERVAEELGADLVVTGVARDEPFGRYLLGGTVERLVRRMPVPVLVARTRPRPYRQVLVASDLSEPSRHALDAAAALFPALPLTLLHAVEVPLAGLLDQPGALGAPAVPQPELERFLDGSALAPEQRARLRVLVERGRPEELVAAYMQDHGVDLVAVGSHGRSAVFEVLIGSTASRILETAPGDVLLVRDPHAVRS